MRALWIVVAVVSLGIAAVLLDLQLSDRPSSVERPGAGVELPAFAEPLRVLSQCGSIMSVCFEPTVARSSSGLAVLEVGGNWIATQTEGVGFVERPFVGGMPTSTVGRPQGDATLLTGAEGDLWFTSMVGTPTGRQIRIARSMDGGGTWARDELVAMPGEVDRPWLVPSEPLWITYNDLASGIRVSRESSGGSFDPVLVAPGVHLHGEAIVDAGALVVPIVRPDGSAGVVRVTAGAVSEETVPGSAATKGTFFPDLAIREDGSLALAWLGAGGKIWMARHADDAWSAPFLVGGGAVAAGPAVIPGASDDDVLYYAAKAGGIALVDARIRGNATLGVVTVADGVTSTVADRPGGTDFVSAVRWEGGIVAVVVRADGIAVVRELV